MVILFFGYTLSVIIKQRQLSQIQKDFINNLTHELKTPISSIALSAKVIADNEILNHPDRLSEYARIIQEQNQRMSKNVEKVLNLASLEKNKIYLNKEKINPGQFLREIIENFRHTDVGAKATIEFIESSKQFNLYADKFHFTNLVLNILENSAKYEDQPHIKILTGISQRHCYIRFIDNGIGVSKKNLKKFSTVSTGFPPEMSIM